jgi:hypothetical protein
VLAVTALPAGSAPSFAGPRFYPSPGFTHVVAIADLNGDGRLDLASANGNQYAPTVSVYLNTGSGTFRAGRGYKAGKYASYSVAIGDLNGDGKPDLATANGSPHTTSVLLNRGDGSFRAKRDYETGAGPASVVIGDLNGDGTADLATANNGESSSSISVLINRGDGSFRPSVDYPTGRGAQSIVIGDLDGDGMRDLATANHDASDVSVLVNNGHGSFRAKVDYRSGRGPESVAIGDLNGDGNPDLATANCGSQTPNYTCGDDANTVSVFLNSGDGTFRSKVDYRTGRHPVWVTIGDLTGDGKPDLATANGSVSVLANKGDGSFLGKRDFEAGDGPSSVAIGELNGDHKPDLALAMWGNRPQFDSGVTVLTNATGHCGVPKVAGKTLPAAKRAIRRGGCRVGRIRRAYSWGKKGLVISQKPRSGTVLPIGGKVQLVSSRGRKR